MIPSPIRAGIFAALAGLPGVASAHHFSDGTPTTALGRTLSELVHALEEAHPLVLIAAGALLGALALARSRSPRGGGPVG